MDQDAAAEAGVSGRARHRLFGRLALAAALSLMAISAGAGTPGAGAFLSTASLSGHVYDTGHLYGLYARVEATLNGASVAEVWSNPVTGAYSLRLPAGRTYAVTASADLPGFAPAAAAVTVSGDTVKNFGLSPDASCTAPGYTPTAALNQDFNGAAFPPAGWAVTNDVPGSNVIWKLSSQSGDGNYTGGSGTSADAHSTGSGPFDTSLVTPSIDISGLGGSTTLAWLENFIGVDGTVALHLDISTDGGGSWTTIESLPPCGTLYGLPGCDISVDIGSYLPPSGTFQLRWRFYDTAGGYDEYAQIDDVSLGLLECTPVAGRLINALALDANTHAALAGASISDENGNTWITAAGSAGGPARALFFEPTGSHVLTATKTDYQDAVKNVTIGQGARRAKTLSFAMQAGRLAARPAAITVDAPVDASTSVPLHIGNTGMVPADWQLASIDAPPGRPHAGHGAPPRSVRCAGRVSPASLLVPGARSDCARAAEERSLAPDPATAWTAIAAYPISIDDNSMATDESSGLVYSFGGYSGGAVIADSYVYDPGTDSWTQIASLPAPLDKPAAAFIGGKAYVTAGWDSSGNSNQALYIYDPDTDSWSTGATEPNAHAGAAGAAVLAGAMYVIGGCYDSYCDGTDAVDRYDPSSDAWTTLAGYPHNNAWEGCGGIGSKVYCAGGASGASTYSDGYAYDPASNGWSAIANLPTNSFGCSDLWGSGYAAADGELLLEGGATCSGFDIINEGFAYDPGSDSWSDLPNSLYPDYRVVGACGFYIVGNPPDAEVLGGYDQCSTDTVPWLSFDPASGTLDPGAIVTSTLTIDGTGQTAGTSETVTVKLSGNTPYGSITVPLTVNWTSAPAKKR